MARKSLSMLYIHALGRLQHIYCNVTKHIEIENPLRRFQGQRSARVRAMPFPVLLLFCRLLSLCPGARR